MIYIRIQVSVEIFQIFENEFWFRESNFGNE